MYRLVMVDDEQDARQRLRRMITMSGANFDIQSEFENGADAYESMASCMPDLLISDIKIPYIDGITLAKRARALMPMLKIIFITGYDEYDYAKEAANLGVVGFANKPLTQEEMNELLAKAERQLDDYYKNNANLSELRDFYERNLSVIRNNDLERLTNMSSVTDNFCRKLANNGIDLDFEYMIMCVVDFDDSQIDEKDVYELTFSFLDKALKENGIESLEYELFSRSDKFGVMLKSRRPIVNDCVEKTFVPLINKVKKSLSVDISVGVSPNSFKNFDFKQMYGQAVDALESRAVIGGGKIFFYQSNSSQKPSRTAIDEYVIKNIGYTVKFKSEAECGKCLAEVKTLLQGQENSNSYYYVVSSIAGIIIRSCSDMDLLNSSYHGYNDIYRKLFEKKTVNELFDFLWQLVIDVRKINDTILVGSMERNLKRVTDYIDENYTKDISLENLSEDTNLSISYISNILKKNLNTTFIKYITVKRINKAKELLRDPSLRIIDVAEMTGYSDSYYFSHCFKRQTGISPKEYRENA